MDAEKFLKQIKKNTDIPRVILLVGDETYFIDKIIKRIKSLWFLNDDDDATIILENEPNYASFRDLLSEQSFFSSRKLVIVENSILFQSDKKKNDKDSYIKILQNIADDCIVVLKSTKVDKRTKVYKEIGLLGTIVECEKIKFYKVKQWFISIANNYDAKWDKEALDLLEEYFSLMQDVSLYFIEQEIEKISLYAGDRKKWTKNDVEEVFSDLNDLSGFALNKALALKDAFTALSILKEQMERGENILKITGLIAYQIRRLWLIKSILKNGGTKDDIIKKAGIAPYFANEIIAQSKNITEKKIKKALFSLSEISRQIYVGGRGFIQVEEIIVDFCS